MLNIKAKTEELNSLIERADEIIATAETETREVTEEEQTEIREISEKTTKISDLIENYNKINELRSVETMDNEVKVEIEETRSIEESHGKAACGSGAAAE